MLSASHRLSPNWGVLHEHINRYVDKSDPTYARSVTSMSRFSFLLDNLRTERLDKVRFQTIDHFPPCIKYQRPESVRFIDALSETWPAKLVVLKVNILQLIQLDYDHFLDLHPVRYDRVKEAIALGEIDMPIVTISPEGVPTVGGGRHRIVALHKYGFDEIELLVPQNEIHQIVSQLKEGLIRRTIKKSTDGWRTNF